MGEWGSEEKKKIAFICLSGCFGAENIFTYPGVEYGVLGIPMAKVSDQLPTDQGNGSAGL